jgi:hypothetical protein
VEYLSIRRRVIGPSGLKPEEPVLFWWGSEWLLLMVADWLND